jgi:hypothetical protein
LTARFLERLRPKLALDGGADKFAFADAFGLGGAGNIAAQHWRQADGQSRSHVRQIKTTFPIWQTPFVSLREIHFDGAPFRRDIAAKALS